MTTDMRQHCRKCLQLTDQEQLHPTNAMRLRQYYKGLAAQINTEWASLVSEVLNEQQHQQVLQEQQQLLQQQLLQQQQQLQWQQQPQVLLQQQQQFNAAATTTAVLAAVCITVDHAPEPTYSICKSPAVLAVPAIQFSYNTAAAIAAAAAAAAIAAAAAAG
jgi:hypothetical protein